MLEMGRIRLFWDSRISAYLRGNFKGHENFKKEDFPELVFKPISNSIYEIFVISDITYLDDSDREDVFESYIDGKETKVYSTRYERDPRNRENAIRAHGRSCMICGFNFEESYGNPGKGFIEVHHNKPVSTFKGELLIDPVQDLTCLCSNCHRMIHRRRNSTLSVEELREYYDKAQEKKRKNQL
jgi:predicted HNH restriction endonuclease